MLEEKGEYENSLNYITGWPFYFLIMITYPMACYFDPGRPGKYLPIFMP